MSVNIFKRKTPRFVVSVYGRYFKHYLEFGWQQDAFSS